MAKFKVPKSLATCADMLYQTREQRLTLQTTLDELKKQESELRKHLINHLPKSDASGIAGKLARATVKMKEVPQARDWSKVWKYIKKNDRFDLLQKRLSDAAVLEMWDNGKEIPGVEHFNAVTISLNKV